MRHKAFFPVLVVLTAFVTNLEGVCDARKEDLLNEIVTIEGSVEILNHSTLGKTPASLTAIIFQRIDCGKCLIVAQTDTKGSYKITVGRGRYRIVKRSTSQGGSPTIDMLASDQPRYIDATSLQYKGNRFDVRIVLPPQ